MAFLNFGLPPEHVLLAGAYAFTFGACLGSFFNVCLARLPRGENLFWPGSRCGACSQPVRWYDNIPLLSYWILRGRCRTCGQTYSARYFWIESLTALACAALVLAGGRLVEW
jgi:leader peptidase (prepilin peptidase) / N-methyltransferase